MRVLVLGAEGIAGRAIMQALPDALGTTLRKRPASSRILTDIDIAVREDLEHALDWSQASVAINCAGIVKSECDRSGFERVRAVNAIAPHLLAQTYSRVIHLSTDCVFDGTRGGRLETDKPDAIDMYGQSKAAGELTLYDHCVTIRTSFIGWDLLRRRGLLEWLRAQRGEAVGYTRAIWSGLSAPELARVICRVLANGDLRGLYHVAGPVISKANLLETLARACCLPLAIRRVEEPVLDRSLDGERFRAETGYIAPAWATMAAELALT